MIPFQREQMIPLQEAPKHLPRRAGGKRIHVSACYRWITRGVRGVVLESVKIGGGIFTSIEAIERFIGRLSGNGAVATPVETPSARQRRIDRATLAARAALGMDTPGNVSPQ